jgi:hypothetical protein
MQGINPENPIALYKQSKETEPKVIAYSDSLQS